MEKDDDLNRRLWTDASGSNLSTQSAPVVYPDEAGKIELDGKKSPASVTVASGLCLQHEGPDAP